MGFVILVLLGGLAWFFFEKSQRKTYEVPPGYRANVELPHEQEFELYHNPLSLCSMKVRICLAELGLPHKSHSVDLIETGSYETLSREYLKINPAGTVPVLVHEGHPIYESHEQIRYAAEHAPPGSPALIPSDPDLRDQMEYWVDCSSLTEDPIENGDESAGNAVPGLTVPIFAAMIDRISFAKILVGLLFHIDRRRPVVFLALKWKGLEKLTELKPAMKIISRSRSQMHGHLDALEKELVESRGPWILGDQFTLADVSWMSVFERLDQVDSIHVFMSDELRPECNSYWERLKGRPSYLEAILECSHPTIEYGKQRLRSAKAADPELRIALEGPAY